MVMSRDDGNSGLLLRLTGADFDSTDDCGGGNVIDLALVTVDTPTTRDHVNCHKNNYCMARNCWRSLHLAA